jgi:hypothetical protein
LFFLRRAKESYEGKRALAKHTELIQLLDAFARSIFDEWSKNVGQAANFNLKQHLLIRNPQTHLITTNFDPQVIKSIVL